MKKKGTHIRSRYILVLMTVICVIFMLLAANRILPIGPVRNFTNSIFVPVQTGINKVGDWLNGQRVGQKNARQLASENSRLQDKVNELEEQNTVLQENEDELTRLRELYDMDSDYSQYDKVAAEVVSKDTGNWYDVFTINRGTSSGVKKDMNVIADGGLVGIVTDAGTNWAKVRSIMDDGSNVSAMVLSSSANCIVSGDLALRDQGKLQLTELNADASATAGDRVVTSNISDKYLPGILIGYIDSVEEDSNNLTKNGYILPVVDFKNIRDVFVITATKDTGDTSGMTTPEQAADEGVEAVSSSSR